MNTYLADKDARDKIISQLDKSFFVEAGAGSGKTYCLVERMVNIIKQGKARIENIAAVTFTRKAAAELKERFQINLESVLRKNISESEKENISAALLNLEQIFIGTIHSFCSKILRERPIEAGVDPGFREIEEDKNIIYADKVWYDFIEKSRTESNNILGFIQDAGFKPEDLKNTFIKFIDYTDVEIVCSDVARPDMKDTLEPIKQLINFFKNAMPAREPEQGWDRLQEIIFKAGNFIASGYLQDDRLFLKLLNEMNKKPKITQNRWPDGNSKEYREKMLKFQEEVIAPALKKWQNYLHKPVVDFVQEAVFLYGEWRKNHSILNFQDLLINTATLLRSNSEVKSYFQKRYTYVLVDEFQDTDPIQAEIILLLTGENVNETDWKNIKPGPGTLFVVGDPKQSIYRFRRADIDIYNLVKKIFSESGGEVLNLYSNFRSLPFMQELVEKIFKGILPAGETRYQAKYFPLNTERKLDDTYDYGVFENPVSKVYRDSYKEAAKIDAAKIANWIKNSVNGAIKLQRAEDEIKQGLDKKPRYSDFLILAKNKKNLNFYAEALEMLGIPYDIAGGESFSDSFELQEIYRLFKAVDDDKDTVSLIAALRGLFFGISDDMLYKFKKAGGYFSCHSEAPEGFLEFEEAFTRLKSYKDLVFKHSPVAAAELIIEKSGIIPLSLSEEEGLTRAGNIYKAIELLKDYGEDRIETFSDLVDRLEELLDNKELESMTLGGPGKNAVRIMNLHKAKGLEAPIVILADPLGEYANHEPDYHITRTGKNRAKGYFTISKPAGNFGREVIGLPPDWDSKLEEEKKYDEAERRRLDYVAITRARNILVVSTYREGKRARAWELMYDYLVNAPKIKAGSEIVREEREILQIDTSEWERVKESINENISKIKSPSYGMSNVTAEAKDGLIFSGTGGEKGKGVKWGKIAHKAIELALRGCYEKLKVLAGKWMEEEEIADGNPDKLIELVDRFMQSSLWKRINKSEHKYFEVPFAVKEGDNIIHGVIDLVFKEETGWVIVDYKTDDFEKDAVRKKAYQKQVELYKKYWEKITGENGQTILICF